jgi:transcriptional regulator with XRE-family HTH domain
MSHPATALSPFGAELRRWRRVRGRSQLQLAVLAETTPRHLSFLETGRSRPSQELVLRLATALEVPLRERNALLHAAGLRAVFPEEDLEAPQLAPIRQVVERLLAQQEPYPAVAFDRAYRMVRANAAARRFLGAEGDWLELIFAPTSPVRASMENFAEVAWAALDLARHEAGAEEACARLERHLAGVPRPPGLVGSPVVSPRFRLGEEAVSTLTTVVRFGNSRAVAVEELRVELIFPADEASARVFQHLAEAAPARPSRGSAARLTESSAKRSCDRPASGSSSTGPRR